MWFIKNDAKVALENKSLRAENAQLKQQLALLTQLLDSKAEIIAMLKERNACALDDSSSINLNLCTDSSTSPGGSSGSTISTHKHKRAAPTPQLALEKEEALYNIFCFVGAGEHLFVSPVCWRWKRTYSRYSQIVRTIGPRTCYAAAVTSPARMRLALQCGLPVHSMSASCSAVRAIAKDARDPVEVVKLARAAKMMWPMQQLQLPSAAAYYGNLPLLRFLCAHGCPDSPERIARAAAAAGDLPILQWLSSFSAKWTPTELQKLLAIAGTAPNGLAAAKWLKDVKKAQWPQQYLSDYQPVHLTMQDMSMPWTLEAVQWAVHERSIAQAFGQWRCSPFHNMVAGGCAVAAERALAILEWGHVAGAPCTCYMVADQMLDPSDSEPDADAGADY